MSKPTIDGLRHLWRQIASKKDWQLVDDEPSFLAGAHLIAVSLGCVASQAACLAKALSQAYSERVFYGISNSRERAAQEIWNACKYLTFRNGLSPDEAEDIAQEVMIRILQRLGTIHSPHGFLSWVWAVRKTVQRNYLARQGRTEPISEHDAIATPSFDEDVVASLLDQRLIDAIETVLDNPLERAVIIDWLINSDQPRDTARRFGLPLYRARVAKNRALQRLQADPEIQKLLGGLNQEPEPPQEGSDDE